MHKTLLRVIPLLALATFAQAAEDWPPRLFNAMYGPGGGGQAKQIKLLEAELKAGADINAPILFSRMLLEGEKPSNLKGTGWPLDAAVELSRVEVVEFLLKNGAKTHGGELATANLRGSAEESLAMTKALLAKGADVNGRRDSFTGLFWACSKGRTATVTLLLEQPGINLEDLTDDGETPLHAAVRGGHVEIVSLLFAAGAKTDVKSKSGNTPVSLAENANPPEKREALLKALQATPK